ncbi:MAG: hypothetical protein WBA22_02500 [Candidatus Methanofastidiosia archaeon]
MVPVQPGGPVLKRATGPRLYDVIDFPRGYGSCSLEQLKNEGYVQRLEAASAFNRQKNVA